jgi:hypothetical protein
MTPQNHDRGKTNKRVLTQITDENTVVNVSRIETPKGERLELEAPDADQRIRLDAVALECLTWQSVSTFRAFLKEGIQDLSSDDMAVPSDETDCAASTELTNITNEFGHVEVRKVESPSIELLELDARKLEFSIRLNATALESVTWQTQDVFTDLIRQDLK